MSVHELWDGKIHTIDDLDGDVNNVGGDSLESLLTTRS